MNPSFYNFLVHLSGNTWFLRIFDALAALVSGVLALAMRLDGQLPAPFLQAWLLAAVATIPILYLIFRWFGMYSRMWRYASVGDLIQVVKAVSCHAAAISGAIFLSGNPYPRGALIMAWLTLLALVGGIRVILRMASDRELGHTLGRGGEPTLILGAGSAGQQLTRELSRHSEMPYHIIGFLDDDPEKLGKSIQGYKVLGTSDDLELIVHNFGITRLVLAVPSGAGSLIRQVSLRGRNLGLTVQTVPSIFEVLSGNVAVSQVRPVQLEDLLRRPPVRLDHSAILEMAQGKTVLITGAGGSIGSEICRQMLNLNPQRLLLLGRGENSIYQITEELNDNPKSALIALEPIICDVRDRSSLERVFRTWRPELVFHAAAHKHVPLMESFPWEAIANNVFGTKNTAELAKEYCAERFVLISTDKAVAPENAMGASKRAAELVVDSLAHAGSTRFMVVRFGNVLGSRGSAPLRFQRQIAAGGPVTITDERMTRYFMTIPEAVQLVLQAGAMGEGGELFILDMGEPVKMLDLIHDLIRLSGLEPEKDIAITVIGPRPGDKLYEELLTPEEGYLASKHEKITVAQSRPLSPGKLETMLQELQELATLATLTPQQVIEVVKKAVR
ncbi:MAG: polysaccharide biosynthesis protein [Symbiobacteriaceae bacterium]|nr:polysaccharide biosynthesis protein [Symbiobacteriaceae bacterium]